MREKITNLPANHMVREAFRNLGPRNPLRKLADEDKGNLFILLELHSRKRHWDELSEPWENAAKAVAEAGTIAARLQVDVFEKLATSLGPFLDPYRSAPHRLAALSRMLGILITLETGKPGHKGRTARTRLLIAASEFVRLKTGRYHDEHLAELMQAVGPRHLGTGEDFSGESISKHRKRMQENYPEIYEEALNDALSFASSAASKTGKTFGQRISEIYPGADGATVSPAAPLATAAATSVPVSMSAARTPLSYPGADGATVSPAAPLVIANVTYPPVFGYMAPPPLSDLVLRLKHRRRTNKLL